MGWNETIRILDEREKLAERLYEALKHLPPLRIVSVVSSFIPMEELKEIVAFQEAHEK